MTGSLCFMPLDSWSQRLPQVSVSQLTAAAVTGPRRRPKGGQKGGQSPEPELSPFNVRGGRQRGRRLRSQSAPLLCVTARLLDLQLESQPQNRELQLVSQHRHAGARSSKYRRRSVPPQTPRGTIDVSTGA